MKTIAINSIKGGTGKSTLAILFVKLLTAAGLKCLAVDADASNHSLSFHFSGHEIQEAEAHKTIFHLFMGRPGKGMLRQATFL